MRSLLRLLTVSSIIRDPREVGRPMEERSAELTALHLATHTLPATPNYETDSETETCGTLTPTATETTAARSICGDVVVITPRQSTNDALQSFLVLNGSLTTDITAKSLLEFIPTITVESLSQKRCFYQYTPVLYNQYGREYDASYQFYCPQSHERRLFGIADTQSFRSERSDYDKFVDRAIGNWYRTGLPAPTKHQLMVLYAYHKARHILNGRHLASVLMDESEVQELRSFVHWVEMEGFKSFECSDEDVRVDVSVY